MEVHLSFRRSTVGSADTRVQGESCPSQSAWWDKLQPPSTRPPGTVSDFQAQNNFFPYTIITKVTAVSKGHKHPEITLRISEFDPLSPIFEKPRKASSVSYFHAVQSLMCILSKGPWEASFNTVSSCLICTPLNLERKNRHTTQMN